MPVIGLVDVADARTCTGDPTAEPLAGDLIVTPAKEAATSEKAQQNRRTAYFNDLSRGKFQQVGRVYRAIYSGKSKCCGSKVKKCT